MTASGGEVGRLSIVGGAEVPCFKNSYIYLIPKLCLALK